ncbi:MAG: hypothetical protein HZC40_03040 [Chloroflexi bacterium]|nr:hypothetical protein [Chloroflexota bacterium]
MPTPGATRALKPPTLAAYPAPQALPPLPAATATPARSLADFLRSFLPVIAGGAGAFTATPTPTRTPTPSPTPTLAPNTFQLIDAALARNAISLDQAATYKMYALFGARSQVPTQYIGTEPVPGDGTLLFLEAMKDWDRLSPATKNLINDFITPKEITNTVPPVLAPNVAVQPTQVAPPQKFSPGTFHIHGALTGLTGNQLQVVTERGATNIAIQPNSILRLDNQNVTIAQLQIGDILDGLIQVDARGQTIALHFAVLRAIGGTHGTNQVSPQVAATASARWSSAVNLASGTGWSNAPTVATDQQNNFYVVWSADGPPAGLRVWYQRGNASATLTIPGTAATDRNPAATVDGQGNLHLAWEGAANERSQVFYARGTWNGTTQTFGWTNPITISPVISTGVNNAYLTRIAATTWNGEPQLHVIWTEVYYPAPGVNVYRQVYRQWRAWTNQWLAPVVLNENANFSGAPALAIALTGRVGITFYESVNANCRVRYRECNLVSANGNCSDATRWTNVETVASSFGQNSHLAFDAASNAHLVWQGLASNGVKTIEYSTKPVTSTQWLTATVLGTSSLELYPMVGSGTPNHMYAVWGDWASNSSVNFRQWDGLEWLPSAKLDQPTGYGERWGALAMDALNRAHLVWQGRNGEIWYASASQTNILLAGCAYTEYYDTPNNFRIYYTRTRSPWFHDCQLWPPRLPADPTPVPDSPVPLDPANGYPYFVTLLGDSLEQSRTRYASMSYPVSQIPRDASNRYPVYISSAPIWFDLPVIGNISQGAPGITLPDHMFIERTAIYSPTMPIDSLRAELGAHEMFHTLQWTYVPSACRTGGQLCNWGTQSDLRWWMEATARWAEPNVYNLNGSYPRDLDAFLREPHRSMTAQPTLGTDYRAYGSFIFASFLEQKVANNNKEIIRTIWQRYKDRNAINGAYNITTAIDEVMPQYNVTSNLANEFPRFTWNNYFMITYTYDIQVTNVYTDLAKFPATFTGPEWKLFRERLTYPRNDWEGTNPPSNGIANAAVFTQRVIGYPWNSFGTSAEKLGAAYIEFIPRDNANQKLNARTVLTVTLATNWSTPIASRDARISVVPMTNFLDLPPRPNTFISTRSVGSGAGYLARVHNFGVCDRVTLIVNNVSRTYNLVYDVAAQTTIPTTPSTTIPCFLELP